MRLSKKILSALIITTFLCGTVNAQSLKIERCDQLWDLYEAGGIKSTWLDLYADDMSWEYIRDKFHKEMDKRFKEKIKDITKDKTIKKCSDCNIEQISSNSLENADFVSFALNEATKPPRGVLIETQEYQCVLYLILKDPEIIAAKEGEISASWQGEISELFMLHRMAKDEIAQEIETVGTAMRIALDSLSEMQVAYVIHRRFQCLIFCLGETRDALKDYFEQVLRIPPKFLNCGYQA